MHLGHFAIGVSCRADSERFFSVENPKLPLDGEIKINAKVGLYKYETNLSVALWMVRRLAIGWISKLPLTPLTGLPPPLHQRNQTIVFYDLYDTD